MLITIDFCRALRHGLCLSAFVSAAMLTALWVMAVVWVFVPLA
ncbi:MAG: hypothetical protein ACJATT_000396 [Myxococcota bacterium]|jgi:hypothetical protein